MPNETITFLSGVDIYYLAAIFSIIGSGIAIYLLIKSKKATVSATLFSDEDLTDTIEHKSNGANVNKIRHKTVSIKLTHIGTITDYFVTIKFQSSDNDVDASYRTINDHELEDDFEGSFRIDDDRKYFRLTVQADEGAASNYITVNSELKALE